ncbi:hypothetical protein MMC08_004823 [Hypocenomyce scalaris]|nr:hypothetical protein [Hypocenomyce scalaris]
MCIQFSECWLAVLFLFNSALSTTHAFNEATSGNYVILKCGAGQANSHASYLQTLLPLMASSLQNAITDVQLGTASMHGYTAFFKTNDNKKAVQSVFQNIADGTSITLDNNSALVSGRLTARPTVVCATQDDAATSALINSCNAEPKMAASMLPASEFIVICPFFWTLPVFPPPNACPTVVNNELTPDNTNLVYSQYAALVHELTHLYNPAEPASGTGEGETYRVQQAVNLNAAQSLANANNFAFYAAGELFN